ncbi:9452_t:CDS:2, partial [Acaulospora morrowiae]
NAVKNSFPVDINLKMNIGYLKDIIKKKMEPYFDNIPAHEINLWSVNIPIEGEDLETKIYAENIKEQYQDLIDKKVILVRAPPFSGKTSIAQIMEHSLVHAPEFSNYRVIRVSLLWRLHISWSTFGERWKSIVGVSWKEWIDQCDLIPTILILDEAQLIYAKDKKVDENNIESADQFWFVVK